MKTSSLFSKSIAAISLLALFTSPTVLSAMAYEAGGSATYIVTDSESTTHPDGTVTVIQTSKSVVVCDDETVPFHLGSQTAVGTLVMDADGNLLTTAGYLHTVDPDGDVMYIWWQGIEGGSEWGFMSGSGKYEGMEGGGTSKLISMQPDGSQVIRWHGKWTMKD